jgi:hypothetical protein
MCGHPNAFQIGVRFRRLCSSDFRAITGDVGIDGVVGDHPICPTPIRLFGFLLQTKPLPESKLVCPIQKFGRGLQFQGFGF